MSFRLSSGTLDSMAGVFAPPKRYRLGTGREGEALPVERRCCVCYGGSDGPENGAHCRQASL
jgi:hypothetical protein